MSDPAGDLGEQVGDVAAVDPAGPRRRREAYEVEQVERGAAAVEDADEVREGVAAVVAGRGGEGAAPLVQLRVDRGQVGRQCEGPQMPEPGQPRQQFAAAVAEADQGALDLAEVAAGVVVEGVASAFGERAQAGPQLVAARPDGLERRAGREAALAMDAVHLHGGGEPVAVLVDALGDAAAAAGGRLGGVPLGGSALRRRGVGRVGGRLHGRFLHTKVLAAHLTSPTISAPGGQRRVGQTFLLGLSLTSCQAAARRRPGSRLPPRSRGRRPGPFRGPAVSTDLLHDSKELNRCDAGHETSGAAVHSHGHCRAPQAGRWPMLKRQGIGICTLCAPYASRRYGSRTRIVLVSIC